MRNYRADQSIHLYMKKPGMLFVAGLLLTQLVPTPKGMAQQATPRAGQASPLIPPAAQSPLIPPAAQATLPPAEPAAEPIQSIGGITVRVVMAPVTVMDRSGNLVEGLQPTDFRLYDNGKLQKITEDLTTHPLSLVVAVQANGQVEKILPQIQKLGSLLQAQVLGDEGEVAVLEFDHRIQKLSDFTSDGDKMSAALKNIKSGSWTSRLNDSAMEGISMLKTRPTNRRRALLLISESTDKGSQIKPREVMAAADFANVVIYSIDMSHLMASLTATPPPAAPDNRPPGALHMERGNVSTPTTETQMQLGNWVPLIKDIFDEAKSVFVKNPLEVYTAYSGGRQYWFMNQKALDHAVSDLGTELHGQYLLTYTPNNQEQPGFHNIVVQVIKPELTIRTRDGYYLAGTAEGMKK